MGRTFDTSQGTGSFCISPNAYEIYERDPAKAGYYTFVDAYAGRKADTCAGMGSGYRWQSFFK